MENIRENISCKIEGSFESDIRNDVWWDISVNIKWNISDNIVWNIDNPIEQFLKAEVIRENI